MAHRKALLGLVAIVLGATCVGLGCSGGANVTTPPISDPLVELNKKLREPEWEIVRSPLRDTIPIPQSGALVDTPDQVLGTLWGLRVRAPKTCKVAHSDVATLEQVPLGRFVEADRSKCRLRNSGDRKVYTFRIHEGAAAALELGGFLGAHVGGERAFEVQIAHPSQVTFEDEEACLPMEVIRKLRIEPSQGFCAMRWAKAALLTTITSRSFSKVEGDVQGAYVVIKIGGRLYSSSEELKETPILSGNYVDLVGRLRHDAETGAIHLPFGADEESVALGDKFEWPRSVKTAELSALPMETDRIFESVRSDPDWKPLYNRAAVAP